MDKKNTSKKVSVSVIIPSYNMGRYIDGSISSALSGGLNNIEVIVVDDGSTDSTRSIVRKYTKPSSKKYDKRVKYKYQKNKGKSYAVNYGLEVSSGKYITILDADDKLNSKSLYSRYNALEAGDGSCHDLVIGGFEVFDEEGKVVGRRSTSNSYIQESVHKKFYFLYKTPFHLNACLFSRELYCRVGSFDTRLKRCQDIDYSLRLIKTADEIAWVHEPVYLYRKHRSDYIKRLRIRGKTLMYRPLVYWKNYEDWRRYVAVFTGVLLDTGKLVYELSGNYTN